MRLLEIWRYPVKSLQGERLAEAAIDDTGLRGDRCWGVRDETTGKILTAKREPRLLLAAAALDTDGTVDITLPSGDHCHGAGPDVDAALTDWLQRQVSLVDATATSGGEAEYYANAIDESSEAISFTMQHGRFVDASPLLLLTTASLRAGSHLHPEGEWEARRFRPNVLIDAGGDGWVEDGWCGHPVRIGSVEVVPREPCVRCTMVTRAQPGLGRDLDVFKSLARGHGATMGVWSAVSTPGSVAVGDAVVADA